MRILLTVAALSLLSLNACKQGAKETAPIVAPVLTSAQALDEFTFARPQEARVTHVSLDLNLDFAAKEVGGTATLDVAAAKDAKEVVLDSSSLRIASVSDSAGKALEWKLGPKAKEQDKGEPLTIQLPAAPAPGARKIVITYKSAPDAEALQWLSPEQTAGGKHPYLFSQGQAILNRSWIPTQDSPGIRQSWDAKITAPAELKVVMSGIIQGEA